MENSPRDKTLWAFAVVAVLVYALIPVVWIISISLKTPETIGDGRFLPSQWTLDNYDSVFSTGFFNAALRNSIGIAIIATLLALVLASMAAYAITRLESPARTSSSRARSRSRCSRRSPSSAGSSTCGAGSASSTPGWG
jgi:multiple sugar transport system permease protein